jgi:hypothetical protein
MWRRILKTFWISVGTKQGLYNVCFGTITDLFRDSAISSPQLWLVSQRPTTLGAKDGPFWACRCWSSGGEEYWLLKVRSLSTFNHGTLQPHTCPPTSMSFWFPCDHWSAPLTGRLVAYPSSVSSPPRRIHATMCCACQPLAHKSPSLPSLSFWCVVPVHWRSDRRRLARADRRVAPWAMRPWKWNPASLNSSRWRKDENRSGISCRVWRGFLVGRSRYRSHVGGWSPIPPVHCCR